MSVNQESLQGAQGSSCEESKSCADQFTCGQATDPEQVRRDLFSDAVRQALARQAGALKGRQTRERAEIDCKGLLTGSELQFLLKQDS